MKDRFGILFESEGEAPCVGKMLYVLSSAGV